MTLDDRMQTAFNDRIHLLETTMTTPPTFDPSSAAGGTHLFSALTPWIAGAAAMLALGVGFSAMRGGDDALVISDQSTTTTEAAEVVESSAPSSTVTTLAPSTTAAPSTVAPSTTVAGGSTTLPVTSASTCSALGYVVTVPAGWFHDSCETFSPAAIPAPGPFEFRPEIDLAYTTSEDYAQALARINSTLTVLSSTPTTVDGLDATIFVIEEEWFDIGQRTIYVVDGGVGVFFASGNELVDSGAVFSDRAAHYADTVVALEAMMATVDVAYAAPAQKIAAACTAPSFTNPSIGPSVQVDIDGDGQLDTVDLIHHAAGVSIVVDAGANGVYAGQLASSDPAHVSNDVVAVDLDADGVNEILASAQSGPAGNSYESFFLNGCDLVPIGGATPALVQRTSVVNVNSFECNFGAHGAVQLDTSEAVYNSATSEYDHSGETFQFDGSAWVSLATSASTSPNPSQLSGPTSCA